MTENLSLISSLKITSKLEQLLNTQKKQGNTIMLSIISQKRTPHKLHTHLLSMPNGGTFGTLGKLWETSLRTNHLKIFQISRKLWKDGETACSTAVLLLPKWQLSDSALTGKLLCNKWKEALINLHQLVAIWPVTRSAQFSLDSTMTSISWLFMENQDILDYIAGCELAKRSRFQFLRAIYCSKLVSSSNIWLAVTLHAVSMKLYTLKKSNKRRMRQLRQEESLGESAQLFSLTSEATFPWSRYRNSQQSKQKRNILQFWLESTQSNNWRR